MISNSTYVSLAILKTNWDDNKIDYLDNFKSFIHCCLECKDKEIITIANVYECVKLRFGIEIPINTIRTIIRRLVKSGICILENDSVQVIKETNIKQETEKRTKDYLRSYEAIIKAIGELANKEGLGNWTEEDSGKSLNSILENYSFSLLNTSMEGSPLPSIRITDTRHRFIISKFIEDISDSDPTLFGYLVTVVKGSMLLNSLVYNDPSKINKKISNLKLYFDTGFIFQLLGLHGIEESESAKNLIQLSYELGIDLKCFSHTYDEIIRVLKFVQKKLKKYGPPGYGKVYLNCIKNNVTASDLDIEIARLQRSLRNYHITIDSEAVTNKYQDYDEGLLESVLRSVVNYTEDHPLLKDIRSIQGVILKRKGRSYYNIEDAKAIFVTTNNNLVNASNKFTNKIGKTGCVPLILTDSIVGNLLWLKNPDIAPDLPVKELMSKAYAGIRPTDELWSKYLGEIDKLKKKDGITDDDFLLLSHSNIIERELMELTKGDSEQITGDNIPELLRRVHSDIAVDKDIKYNHEKYRHEHLRNRVDVFSNIIGKIVALVIVIPIFILYLIGFYYSVMIEKESILKYVAIIIFIIITLFGIFNVSFLKITYRNIGTYVSKKIKYLFY